MIIAVNFFFVTYLLLAEPKIILARVLDIRPFQFAPYGCGLPLPVELKSCSTGLLNFVASDIHNFAIAHNMRLNPTKCKEMRINFLRNSNCLINPIIIGGNVIERVNTYKILGVIMDNDLKWNCHVDYIVKKACKKLYSLGVLRRPRVS